MRSIVGNYFHDSYLIQFCFLIFHPARRPRTTFANHIIHIILVRPDKKMKIIYARSNVAMVQYLLSIRDLSIVYSPRYPVTSIYQSVYFNAAVSLIIDAT